MYDPSKVFFFRHTSVKRMSHYESKPERTEKQLWLSHVNEFLKMSSEFPVQQQGFLLHYYTNHKLICVMIWPKQIG